MRLKLAEDMTVTSTQSVKLALLDALSRDDELLLDGADVRTADVAGLQVLCAAHRTAALSGKRVAFAEGSRSAVLDHAARVLGLERSEDEADGWLWPRREAR